LPEYANGEVWNDRMEVDFGPKIYTVAITPAPAKQYFGVLRQEDMKRFFVNTTVQECFQLSV
jgi:hypothetical protein